MRILKFIVHSVTKYYQASKIQRQIWLCSTAKFTEQVHQLVLSRDPPPKQQKLVGAKLISGGELKKLVVRYVVEEMLPLNTVDLPSFGAIINKIPTTIIAVLPHRTYK